MIEISEAIKIISTHIRKLKPEIMALTSSTLGQVLAVDVKSDIDSPPFDKSMMDGYALRAVDCVMNCELLLVEEIQAGATPKKTVGPGECSRIFTGAPMPQGANAVVMIEKSAILSNGKIQIHEASIAANKNVIRRGTEMMAGDVVLPAGTHITPSAFGLFAACGKTAVSCISQPRVSVLCTGDEVVEANMKPMGAQIRNSNGPMLVTQAVRAGALPRYLGIGRDDETTLTSLIKEGLSQSDVFILAGGVSAGKFDIVPKVLEACGVKIHFHKVRMKPGKPLLFGSKGDVLVFGLPGNPVSGYVGFELFVRPVLEEMAGKKNINRQTRLTLSEPLSTNNDRPTYHPARISAEQVQPLKWFGSADLRGLLSANAFLVLPAGEIKLDAGSQVDVIPVQ